MKRLDTSNISGSVGQPVTDNTLDFIQDAHKETIDALIQGLLGSYTTGDLIKLYGCSVTFPGSLPGTGSITAGAIYYNGEVYLVDANASISVGSGQTIVFVTDDQPDGSADPVKLTNGVDVYVHRVRKIKAQAGASGSGIADYNGAVVKTLDQSLIKATGRALYTKVIDIGAWNMDVNDQTILSHGLADYTKIRSVSVLIIADGPGNIFPLATTDVATYADFEGSWNITSASIVLQRRVSGFFDSIFYDDTAINRGWVTITYEG